MNKPVPRRLRDLSRRERQIMDAVISSGSATASQIHASIADAPSLDAIRRMIRILEEKGFLQHTVDGPRHVYSPTVKPEAAGKSAVDHLLKTYFKGSISQAMAAMLEARDTKLSEDELNEIRELIENTEREEQ